MALSQLQITMNEVRRAGVVQQFEENIGQRLLIIIEQYPFFIVGGLQNVESAYAHILIEVSNIPELDDYVIRTHIDDITVFFFERV
ncbi:hypothetical protein J2T13_005081 [Paenibacillus sp. DS2015]|uniref:hypothetical protein n=1 Tax=Paenibacillus sp. DS2015 TaxID=3373917 RepID=UPI003D1E8447